MARPPNTTALAEKVFEKVANRGLLLQSGIEFPSATTTICGTPVSGSWWSHPKSSLIHWVLEELDDHPHLTTAKLINGKVTIIHLDLWPPLVAVGCAHEPWQLARLTPLAKSLLKKASRESFRLDELRSRIDGKPSDAIRALEKRLLIHTHEIHTDHGKHTKFVRSWENWWASDDRRRSVTLPSVEDAKATIEEAVAGFDVKLPWW